jgi:chaperone required for assembly of F1-ATPase
MRRFYETAAAGADGPPHPLLLDGKPVLTPQRQRLALPTPELAAALAEEWQSQSKELVPAKMPLTRLAHGAIDLVAPDPSRAIDEITAYAGSDLLCYRTESPDALAARQAKLFDPILAWAADHLGSGFVTVVGVMPRNQPDETLAAVSRLLAAEEPFPLVALHAITTLTGSAVLALALAEGRIGAEEAWAAAHVDEDWQIAQWGEDAEAAQRRAAQKVEFLAACRLLDLIGGVRRCRKS